MNRPTFDKPSRVLALLMAATLTGCCGAADPTPPADPSTQSVGTPGGVATSGSCASRLDSKQVVARWSGGELTYGQLLGGQAELFSRLRAGHARQQLQLERAVVRELLDEQLVAQAARDAGKTKASWLGELYRTVLVSAAEVRAFYDDNLQDEGLSFESQKAHIHEYLTQRKREAALRTLLDELERGAQASVSLPAPPEAVVRLSLEGRPTKGAADAATVIVVFGDYQCPYCSLTRQATDALLKSFPGRVKVVAMHYPLDSHPAARVAALAAECAHQQGRFWPMHDQLYDHQHTLSAQADGMVAHATAAGLDLDAFQGCMASPATAIAIDADVAQGDGAGVEATPSVYVNGVAHQGVPSVAELRLLLQPAG